MCMIYYSHTGSVGDDIFVVSYYQTKAETSFLFSQKEIITHYYRWLADAIKFDFGQARSYPPTSVLSEVTEKFILSGELIFLSLVIGIIISIIFIIISKFHIFSEFIIEPILALSYSHLLVTIIIFKIFFDIKIGTSLLPTALILCFGSGFLSDLYYLLNKEYANIMNKDYAVFAEYSGFSKFYFALKELIISLISISTSRIPILFGGMIIIEIISSGAQQHCFRYLLPVFSSFWQILLIK